MNMHDTLLAMCITFNKILNRIVMICLYALTMKCIQINYKLPKNVSSDSSLEKTCIVDLNH